MILTCRPLKRSLDLRRCHNGWTAWNPKCKKQWNKSWREDGTNSRRERVGEEAKIRKETVSQEKRKSTIEDNEVSRGEKARHHG